MAETKSATISEPATEEAISPSSQDDGVEGDYADHQDQQDSDAAHGRPGSSDEEHSPDAEAREAYSNASKEGSTGGRPEDYAPDSDQSDDNPTEENAWVPTWDEESQAYYWWNTVTNETTWDNPYPDLALAQEPEEGNSEQAYYEQSYQGYGGYYYDDDTPASNPLDAVLNKIDTEVRSQLDNSTDNTSKPFHSYNELFEPQVWPQAPVHSYDSVAHFNARTGKFTSSKEADRLNPEYMSVESRAKRQMQYFFDVDAYQEQRNRERLANSAGVKRPLSKKEIEKFKRQKQEKKEKRKREWLSKDQD